MPLNTQPNLPRPDDLYETLIDVHRNLDEGHSATLNSQLILLLANHIGDIAVLREALAVVRLALPAITTT